MSRGFDELDPAASRRRRFCGLDLADRGATPSSGRIGSFNEVLVIALCCVLFLALVVLRG